MQVDSICKDPLAAELRITPKSLESIAPLYIAPNTKGKRFDNFRREAAR
jgi:NADH dehydrogenase